MNDRLDPVTAEVVRHLTPTARRRLDSYVDLRRQLPTQSQPLFTAGPGEMPDLRGVTAMEAEVLRGRIEIRLDLGVGVRWCRHQISLRVDMPDTLIAAMRGRPVTAVVEHPLLEGLTISSARRADASVLVEIKRMEETPLREVSSMGVERPVDIIETLRALGATRICRVAASAVEAMSPVNRYVLAGRLADRREGRMIDLLPWPPRCVESLACMVKGDELHARAGLTSGSFHTGWLNIHGSSRSRSAILGSGLFRSYKALGPAYQARRPRDPFVPLAELADRLQKQIDRRVAA